LPGEKGEIVFFIVSKTKVKKSERPESGSPKEYRKIPRPNVPFGMGGLRNDKWGGASSTIVIL